MALLSVQFVKLALITLLPVSSQNTTLREPGAADLSRAFRLVESGILTIQSNMVTTVIETVVRGESRSVYGLPSTTFGT